MPEEIRRFSGKNKIYLHISYETRKKMDAILFHRSIRRFRPDPVPETTADKLIEAASRASTTGNMQLYSIVLTASPGTRAQLAPCHFNQPAAVQAPLLATFCADVHRFSQWCRQRGAEPAYDNFAWFVNAATDALLASQNFALAAESEGLGICYLGTTLYTADRIVEVLKLPRGVAPVTTVAVGYPDENPPLTDRLPPEAVVHRDTYRDYAPEDIDRLWAEREASEETRRLLRENGLDNLARIFTLNRYKKEDNLAISKNYLEVLKKQGFFNQ